eukprot:140881-Prymnesium_polylepis.1
MSGADAAAFDISGALMAEGDFSKVNFKETQLSKARAARRAPRRSSSRGPPMGCPADASSPPPPRGRHRCMRRAPTLTAPTSPTASSTAHTSRAPRSSAPSSATRCSRARRSRKPTSRTPTSPTRTLAISTSESSARTSR